MENLENQFYAILTEKILVKIEDINDDARFLTELEFDAMEMVDLIKEIENEFKISIRGRDIKHFITIGDAKKYLKNCLQLVGK
tara:strand:+ start:1486 stop:1734 length:249 start_codon:yes stop_codon:yes gene_type:complete